MHRLRLMQEAGCPTGVLEMCVTDWVPTPEAVPPLRGRHADVGQAIVFTTVQHPAAPLVSADCHARTRTARVRVKRLFSLESPGGKITRYRVQDAGYLDKQVPRVAAE